jgi:FkbM family methyltransferase
MIDASPAWYRFRPSWSWIEHVWKSTVLQDHKDLIPHLRAHLPADGVAIDIGAHGGQVTRLLADMAPSGTVVAVEPSGYSRSVLHLALLARPRRNVRVVATALGEAPGLAMMATPLKRHDAMGYGAASLAPDPERKAVRELVPVATLDALVAAMDLRRVDFLKIDVEGYEAAVLLGARDVLTRFHPAILVEIDNARLLRAGTDIETLWAYLTGLGYVGLGLPEDRPPAVSGDWLFTWAG